MGIVYKARDPFIDRIVAIKTIHLDGQIEEEDLAARLELEAKSAGRLQHPNICTVFDFGKEDDLSFIVIEYAEGFDLQELIDSSSPVSLPQKLDLLIQVAHGLGYAHEMGVVHRDMKPANIRVTKKGTAKIIDFGLARFDTTRLTRTGFVSGTVAYMSPERFSGQSGPSDDIFALGAVAYELLTYQRAFPGSSPPEVMMKIISGEPPAPSSVAELPSAIDPIVRRCMARDVADRYSSAADFAADLEDLYTTEDYQQFIQSPQRSPEFTESLSEWIAARTTHSSGRNRLRAGGVPTVTIEQTRPSEKLATGKTAVQPKASAEATEILESGTIASSDAAASVPAETRSEARNDDGDIPPESLATVEASARPPALPTMIEHQTPQHRTSGRRLHVFALIAVIAAAVAVALIVYLLGEGRPEPAEPVPEVVAQLEPQGTTPRAPETMTLVSEPDPAAEAGRQQLQILSALRDEAGALPLNGSERIRLREIETVADLAATRVQSGDGGGVAEIERSIQQIRQLVRDHEARLAAERASATTPERRPIPAPREIEPVRTPATTTTTASSPPPVTASVPPREQPPAEPVPESTPQRTEAEARSEVRSFVNSLAGAYENRDVGFFRSRYDGYSDALADAIRNSPSAQVSIAIDSISFEGTERATVHVTRTDEFSESRIPAAVQKLTYQLRRADGEWRLLSFARR